MGAVPHGAPRTPDVCTLTSVANPRSSGSCASRRPSGSGGGRPSDAALDTRTAQRGASTFTVGTPVRMFVRLAGAKLLKGPGGSIGSGDLAGVLMFVGHARRF